MCRMKLFQVLLTTTHSRNYRRIGGEWGIESSGGTKLCENQKKKKRKEICLDGLVRHDTQTCSDGMLLADTPRLLCMCVFWFEWPNNNNNNKL